LRAEAKKAADFIKSKIRANVERLQHKESGGLHSLTSRIGQRVGIGSRVRLSVLKPYTQLGIGSSRPYEEFLVRYVATGKPLDELVPTVLGLSIGSGANYAQGIGSYLILLYMRANDIFGGNSSCLASDRLLYG
jgi:hypothetical protein